MVVMLIKIININNNSNNNKIKISNKLKMLKRKPFLVSWTKIILIKV